MIENYRIFIILFLFSVFTEGYSEEGKSRDINIGAGWAQTGLRDNGISPLYYSGSHAVLTSGFRNHKDIIINNLQVHFLSGRVTPANYPGLTQSQMKSMKGGINYSYLRLAGKFINERGEFFIGGVFDSQFGWYEHNQMINSAVNNFFISTVNVSGSFSYPLTVNGRELNLGLGICIPVLALIVRPSDSYIKPAGFLDHNDGDIQRILNSIEVSSLNRFSGITSETSLEYRLWNNHAIRIGYRWEYFGHNDTNRLQSATHGITLQTIFSL